MPAEPLTCSRCDTTWTGVSRCHCAACCRTFSGITLFDAHRNTRGEHGGCDDPSTLKIASGPKEGEPLMHLRDGVWSYPEMDAATKAERFGR